MGSSFMVFQFGQSVLRVAMPPATSAAGGARKKQVDESLSGRLWLMVGEAGSFVGLDNDVLVALRIGHHEIQARDRDVDAAAASTAAWRRVGAGGR